MTITAFWRNLILFVSTFRGRIILDCDHGVKKVEVIRHYKIQDENDPIDL